METQSKRKIEGRYQICATNNEKGFGAFIIDAEEYPYVEASCVEDIKEIFHRETYNKFTILDVNKV